MEYSKYTHILLVDDNETTLFYNEDVAGDLFLGAEIICYQDAQLLLVEYSEKFCSNDKRVLMFLDLNMSLSGYDLLQELEDELESIPNLDVIILTSSRLKRDVERSQVFGNIIGYIEKPLTQDKLESLE